ncbi:unnamed protein product [Rotaria sp. Silwood1]|nr:unnamed protein product [Rotaria sp. Silwood1]
MYSTEQWISSFVHIYDIKSDGFTDDTQPVLIYPNSEQILFSEMNIVLLRLVCSKSGNLAVFDNLGNAATLLSAPAGMYPYTRVPFLTSSSVPCIPGTHRNYSGLELCIPCPNGTFSSDCVQCARNDSFCPYGSIQDLSYSTFESIDQDQDYPEAPETTVFDDLLMKNMFTLNTQSAHCIRVSPMTWVLLVLTLGIIVAIVFWIGGLVSIGIIVIVVSAYAFSNTFLHQYPIESIIGEQSFACDVTLRNAKFSTTMQKMPGSSRSIRQNQAMFDLLNLQAFDLKIDLIQTAFTCQDSLVVYRLVDYILLSIPISRCETSYNGSILSLTIPLTSHDISIQLTLPGLRTVGGIRVGLFGPLAASKNGR